jgi:hypothetical protein
MRLDDSYLRGIAYIGCARPGFENQIDAHGTGFLVVHDGQTYLVTAAHVAVDFQDGAMDVRLNRTDDGLGGIEHIDTAKWYWHPDNRIDLAVMPFVAPGWAGASYFPSKHIATAFKVGTKNFGAGDLCYVVGMFDRMKGKEKNIPVVHTGYIGSMGAGEKLIRDDWREGAKSDNELEVEGYLIQVPTLEGSSGSPVYVRRTLNNPIMQEVGTKKLHYPLRAWTYGSVWLLGVWVANWEVTERGRTIGVGMGLCVPGDRIMETLDQPELVAMREAKKQKQ